MYAVVSSGGKQHRVAEGDVVRVEKIGGDVGSNIELDQVLLIGGDAPQIGTPLVEGARVTAEIVQQGRGKKVMIFTRKRRKGFKRLRGHRQPFTHLKIKSIEVG